MYQNIVVFTLTLFAMIANVEVNNPQDWPKIACTVGIRLGQVTTADLMEKTQDVLDC